MKRNGFRFWLLVRWLNDPINPHIMHMTREENEKCFYTNLIPYCVFMFRMDVFVCVQFFRFHFVAVAVAGYFLKGKINERK